MMDKTGLDWIGLDWAGLDRIGLDRIAAIPGSLKSADELLGKYAHFTTRTPVHNAHVTMIL